MLIPTGSSSASQRDVIEEGINYKVIDVYPDGTQIVREVRNTNDPITATSTALDQVSNPLGTDKSAILGSDDILISQWNSISSSNFPGDLGFQSISYQQGTNFTESLAIGRFDNMGTADDDVGPSNIAAGDLDGNLRQDAISVFYTNGYTDGLPQIGVKVMESWGSTNSFATLADNYLMPFGGDQAGSNYDLIPQVITPNLDDDAMSEIVIYALDGGVPTIWVFDDLAMSNASRQVKYGDEISVRTPETHSSYFFSTGNGLTVAYNRGETVAESEFRFTLVNPYNRSDVGTVFYGAPFSLLDSNGKYLSISTSSGGAKFVDIDTLTENEIFSFEASDPEKGFTGQLFSNVYATIKSRTGFYLDGIKGAIGTAQRSETNTVYKISLADQLPYNFDGTLKYKIKFKAPELVQFSTLNFQFYQTQNLAFGDIDGDGRDEFVISGSDGVGGVYAKIFDDAGANYTVLKTINWSGVSGVSPAIGDLDNDGEAELVIALHDENQAVLMTYESNFTLVYTSPVSSTLASQSPRMKIYDMDKDGSSELFYLTENSYLTVFSGLNQDIVFEQQLTYTDGGGDYFGDFPSFDFGDVDLDGTDEFVLAYSYSQVAHAMSILEWNETSLAEEYFYVSENVDRLINAVAVADFNGDAYTVEFTGQRDRFTTPGEIAVVAAAPPNQLGVSQNYALTGTTFGKAVSNSETDGNEVSSGYNWFVGFQVKPEFFDLIEVGAGFTYEYEKVFTTTNTKTRTITVTEEFAGGYLDDFVLYSAASYDVFYYKILDAADEKMIGEEMTINIPRDPSMFIETKEYYNAQNDETEMDIGENIFSHTPGDVASYMREDEIATLEASTKILRSPLKTVGQGGGAISVRIDLSEEDANGYSTTITEQYKFDGTFLVNGIGPNGGYGLTSGNAAIHETSVGKNTAIQADVGSISDEGEYNAYRYSFGMLFYNQTVVHKGLSYNFYVINYWVDLPPEWVPPTIVSTSSESNILDVPLQIYAVLISLVAIPSLRRKKKND